MITGIFSSPAFQAVPRAYLPGYYVGTEGGFFSPTGMKLTTNLHVVARLRMSGGVLSVPHVPLWRAQI